MRPRKVTKSPLAEPPELLYFKIADPRLYHAGVPHVASIAKRISRKRTNASLFTALAGTVIGQQLSTKAASTIRGKVTEACGRRGITAESLEETSFEKLREAGVSAAKVKTLKALAHAVVRNEINLLQLRELHPEEAAQKLLALWGIGPWTVEMFFMFSLGMPDIFSSGDLGLARGMELLYGLPKNTERAKLEEMAKVWAPHRTYASLILWSHYDSQKS